MLFGITFERANKQRQKKKKLDVFESKKNIISGGIKNSALLTLFNIKK